MASCRSTRATAAVVALPIVLAQRRPGACAGGYRLYRCARQPSSWIALDCSIERRLVGNVVHQPAKRIHGVHRHPAFRLQYRHAAVERRAGGAERSGIDRRQILPRWHRAESSWQATLQAEPDAKRAAPARLAATSNRRSFTRAWPADRLGVQPGRQAARKAHDQLLSPCRSRQSRTRTRQMLPPGRSSISTFVQQTVDDASQARRLAAGARTSPTRGDPSAASQCRPANSSGPARPSRAPCPADG